MSRIPEKVFFGEKICTNKIGDIFDAFDTIDNALAMHVMHCD